MFVLSVCHVVSDCVGNECVCVFFFQAEDGIRDLVRSRGLGDVYKRQHLKRSLKIHLWLKVSFLDSMEVLMPRLESLIT